MTLKQLAERIGVVPSSINFELAAPCEYCQKVGGNEVPCDGCNHIAVTVELKEDL